MIHEVSDGAFFGTQSADVFFSHLVNNLNEMLREQCQDGKNRALSDWGEGSREHEIVRHVVSRKRYVACRELLPHLGEVGAVEADYGKARPEGGIETCCADDDINFHFLAITRDKARRRDSSNILRVSRSLLADEGLKITISWSRTSTGYIEILWDHPIHQMYIIAELCSHLLVRELEVGSLARIFEGVNRVFYRVSFV